MWPDSRSTVFQSITVLGDSAYLYRLINHYKYSQPTLKTVNDMRRLRLWRGRATDAQSLAMPLPHIQ